MTSSVDPTSLLQVSDFGFFTWSVVDNLVFGDPVLALFYDLDVTELARGVPVERILERIIPEDREKVARRIHAAILSGEPAVFSYHAESQEGGKRPLVSFGRCLFDECGVPSFYSGAVMSGASSQVTDGVDPLESYCKAALSLAKVQGYELAARYLSSAIGALGSRKPSFL